MIKEEIVLKGFVAVDNGGDKMTWNPSGRRVVLFEKKPFRDTLTRTPYWASPYSKIQLDWDSFSNMSWNDEPIEAELKVIIRFQTHDQYQSTYNNTLREKLRELVRCTWYRTTISKKQTR